jgi:hypothetical protein
MVPERSRQRRDVLRGVTLLGRIHSSLCEVSLRKDKAQLMRTTPQLRPRCHRIESVDGLGAQAQCVYAVGSDQRGSIDTRASLNTVAGFATVAFDES